MNTINVDNGKKLDEIPLLPADMNSIFSSDKKNGMHLELPNPIYGNFTIIFFISASLLIIFAIAKSEKQLKVLYKSIKDKYMRIKNKRDEYFLEDDFKLEEEFIYKRLTDI